MVQLNDFNNKARTSKTCNKNRMTMISQNNTKLFKCNNNTHNAWLPSMSPVLLSNKVSVPLEAISRNKTERGT